MTTNKQTETPVIEGDRYAEPREKADPDHKDAGQEYVERQERDRKDAEKAAEKA